MKKKIDIGGTFATVFVLLASVFGCAREDDTGPPAETTASVRVSSTAAPHDGLIYGRVVTDGGAVHEGRLRWGGDEEALWSNYFNGFKPENPWLAHAPGEQLPKERVSIDIAGIEVVGWDHRLDLGRPFMARFGDIARIDGRERDLLVTLKSGTEFDLDRFGADDLADGVRVWDGEGGFVDIGEWRIRTIEFLPNPGPAADLQLLHGTVRTPQGDFTGLVQWNRRQCVGSDELTGHTSDGPLALRFDQLRSIERLSPNSARVTLLDGREIALSGTRDVGDGNNGLYVDDHRYGRVLVSWDAFERVDFSPGGAGPSYEDFPPGRPLMGTVVTRSGRHLAGRLVYDLDESETTETLDAPSRGVAYTIPFAFIASIAPAHLEDPSARGATVTLRTGEELRLERDGDLSAINAGMLIFIEGRERPEYVPWADVERIDLDPARPL